MPVWGLPSAAMRLRAGVVDICLIPEVNFDVPALMAHARLLLQQKGHIVVRACSYVILTPCSVHFTEARRSKHVRFATTKLFVTP